MNPRASQTERYALVEEELTPLAGYPGKESEGPETVIAPISGWRAINLRELWNYRELLFFLAWRDVKVRYKQTVLGATWAILQPLLITAVFSVFLGWQIPRYPMLVYTGLLLWSFFATALAHVGNSVVDQERLVTKVYFPRLAIPFAAVGAAFIDFLVASSVLVLLMVIYGVPPAWSLLLVPFLVILGALAALGIGTLLAALNVAYRDFRYAIPFLLQVWMLATPSIYMPTAGAAGETGTGSPASVLQFSKLNPMTGLITFFRAAVLGQALPWLDLTIAVGPIAIVLVLGSYYFRRVEDSFADII
jgi:lipopolysaccharide transport system permease protein